ncbi:MAG: LysR family transcriptional regulator [Gammaproteobacteria bacterium]|nr:LysR family transcriptional regulator [Gammaproteobacteria bacterium]MCP5299877.1 LysR family transcriptional regulator [Chromatiaceae bacterium]
MDIAALHAFVEVADLGSFSAAAEALYLTQPAVSKRVAQLESELDTRLFDRIGRRVALTAAGEILLPRARNLINDAREIKRVVADLSGDVRGRLVMGTSHHIGLHRLPQPLKRYTERYPDVELDIRFMDSEAACRAVETGDLELAIVTLPPAPPPNLQMLTIWDDPLAFMVASDHPLAGRGPVTLDELLEHPAVLPGSTTYTRAILEQAVRSAGAELRVGMATNYLETLHMLVATGLGWSLLPATVLDDQVRVIAVEGMRLSRRLGVVTHRRRSLSNAGSEMIRTCREDAAGNSVELP